MAAATVGLGEPKENYLRQIVPPVLASFTDQDSRVRYYACEALYNIAKVRQTISANSQLNSSSSSSSRGAGLWQVPVAAGGCGPPLLCVGAAGLPADQSTTAQQQQATAAGLRSNGDCDEYLKNNGEAQLSRAAASCASRGRDTALTELARQLILGHVPTLKLPCCKWQSDPWCVVAPGGSTYC